MQMRVAACKSFVQPSFALRIALKIVPCNIALRSASRWTYRSPTSSPGSFPDWLFDGFSHTRKRWSQKWPRLAVRKIYRILGKRNGIWGRAAKRSWPYGFGSFRCCVWWAGKRRGIAQWWRELKWETRFLRSSIPLIASPFTERSYKRRRLPLIFARSKVGLRDQSDWDVCHGEKHEKEIMGRHQGFRFKIGNQE